MKSGDFSISRDDISYQSEFAKIQDRQFVQRTFSAQPALVAKEAVNGHRMWKEYDGKPYDSSRYDLVEGMWDHEHCSICFFKITDGFTYWENTKRIKLLCDACYETFSKS